jgi:hypothetical protein
MVFSASLGMAGLAVTYGLNLNARQSRWVLSLCKLENRIISVERIQQYTRLPQEAPAVIKGARPPQDWPTSGTIEFVNLQACLYSILFPIFLPNAISHFCFLSTMCDVDGLYAPPCRCDMLSTCH